MKNIITTLFLIFIFTLSTYGQTSFAEKCIGVWKGNMKIYAEGALKDSVDVRFTVAKTKDANIHIWKMEYLSMKTPIVKDYKLQLVDASKGAYLLDEGDDLVLNVSLLGDKLYSLFGVSGMLFTATYELVGDELIFEVSSGKQADEVKGVTNFVVKNLQRVVLTKSNEKP